MARTAPSHDDGNAPRKWLRRRLAQGRGLGVALALELVEWLYATLAWLAEEDVSPEVMLLLGGAKIAVLVCSQFRGGSTSK